VAAKTCVIYSPLQNSDTTPFGIAPDFHQFQELPSPQPATLIAHRVMA
jgi:hypothetical protein